MFERNQRKLRFRLLTVLVLALGVLVLGYGNRVVDADQYSDIEACYNTFSNRVGSCQTSQSNCAANCANYTCNGLTGGAWTSCMNSCIDSCEDTVYTCYGNAITGGPLEQGFSACLMENVFFTLEMCPNAPAAAQLCDDVMASCEDTAETIVDEQERMALVADCMDAHYTCLDQSGAWQCY